MSGVFRGFVIEIYPKKCLALVFWGVGFIKTLNYFVCTSLTAESTQAEDWVAIGEGQKGGAEGCSLQVAFFFFFNKKHCIFFSKKNLGICFCSFCSKKNLGISFCSNPGRCELTFGLCYFLKNKAKLLKALPHETGLLKGD